MTPRRLLWPALFMSLVFGCGDTHPGPVEQTPIAVDGGSTGDNAGDPDASHPASPGLKPDAATELPEADAHVQDPGDAPRPTSLPGCFTRRGDSESPFTIDVVLDCSESNHETSGVRVATDGVRATLVTTALQRAVLLQASDTDAELQLLPRELTLHVVQLATHDSGTHMLLAETTSQVADDAGALTFLHHDGSAWRTEVVFDREVGWTIPYGFEVAPDGLVHAWFADDAPLTLDHATRSPDGTWTHEPMPPSDIDTYTLDPAGRTVALGREPIGEQWQAVGMIGEQRWLLAEPSPYLRVIPMARATPSAPADVPPFAALLRGGDGLIAAWPKGQDGSVERVVLGAVELDVAPACSAYTESGGCNQACEERYDSVSTEDVAFAQTSDGRGWMVWLETHFDRAFTYEFGSCSLPEGPWPDSMTRPAEICTCRTNLVRDETSATLHVARVTFPLDEVTEVLALPIAPSLYGTLDDSFEDTRVIDARAFDDQLAIGIRLRGAYALDQWSHVYRLLQLDTSQL